MRFPIGLVLSLAAIAGFCLSANAEPRKLRIKPSILELAYVDDGVGEEPAEAVPEEAAVTPEAPTEVAPVEEATAQTEATPAEAAPTEAAGDGLPNVEDIFVGENLADDVLVRVVTNVIERVVEVTNTVERVVEVNFAEAYNTDLAERNERLEQALAIERERRERLERVVPKSQQAKTGRPAKITSASTFYDRKEGVVMFDRNVHVDDENFQMWADKAYVFLQGTNDVRRIVAIGNVALTNEARRAYGVKASYYKDGGMVVLYGNAEQVAEVRDESKVDDQSVKGSKIKFWIDSEQVQVIDADIQAPVQSGGSGGIGDFKKIINK